MNTYNHICKHDNKDCHEPDGGCQPCYRSIVNDQSKNDFMEWYCGEKKLYEFKRESKT